MCGDADKYHVVVGVRGRFRPVAGSWPTGVMGKRCHPSRLVVGEVSVSRIR